MVQRLEERNWVLTLRGPGLYGFVHRTFLEYLCAVEPSERFKAQQLDIDTLIRSHVVPRLDDDIWYEALRLLVGSLPPPAAEQILLAILPTETETTADASQLVLSWQRLSEAIPPTEAETTADASRLVLAWQGLSEVEPRSIPTLVQNLQPIDCSPVPLACPAHGLGSEANKRYR